MPAASWEHPAAAATSTLSCTVPRSWLASEPPKPSKMRRWLGPLRGWLGARESHREPAKRRGQKRDGEGGRGQEVGLRRPREHVEGSSTSAAARGLDEKVLGETGDPDRGVLVRLRGPRGVRCR